MNEYTITQLTDNDIDDTSVKTSNGNVVWSANDGNDNEIFFYDGNSTSQITDNQVFDNTPQISGDNLVWQRTQQDPLLSIFDENEIIFYDGTTSNSIATVNNFVIPAISGNNVVWVSGDGITSSELFLYNGTETIKLTSDETQNISGGSISGNKVVWSKSDGNDTEIFLYDQNTTIQITDNDVNDDIPFILPTKPKEMQWKICQTIALKVRLSWLTKLR